MLHAKRIAFLQGFLRRPGQVASVVPSSRFLERRLVSLADLGRARLVVELGAGTGGTTRALLAALPAGARLLCIELNPYFARLLERHPDPRLIVHEGSAENLPEILESHGLAAPDVVVSGIPFSTIPAAIGTRIIESIRAALAPGGCFVAYQLRGVVADLATPLLGAPDVTLELLNIPPVRVFRWRVAGAASISRIGRAPIRTNRYRNLKEGHRHHEKSHCENRHPGRWRDRVGVAVLLSRSRARGQTQRVGREGPDLD